MQKELPVEAQVTVDLLVIQVVRPTFLFLFINNKWFRRRERRKFSQWRLGRRIWQWRLR